MANNDQTILDVIAAVSTDLRHTASFRELLRTLDDETARKIAQKYIEFLYHALEIDPPQNGANNNRPKVPLAMPLFGAAVARG
jgi:hypothetical protein